MITFALLVLTGCANYQHENPSPDAPKITFGDRFGDDGDARSFRANPIAFSKQGQNRKNWQCGANP